jgi:hypothetical protein
MEVLTKLIEMAHDTQGTLDDDSSHKKQVHKLVYYLSCMFLVSFQ